MTFLIQLRLNLYGVDPWSTYIVAVLERALHARVHVVVVQGHEHGVHHDAQCDEQIHERVEHDEGEKLRQPAVTGLRLVVKIL